MKKPFLTASKKNLLSAIVFTLLTLVSFFNLKTLWKTGLICMALAITFFGLYVKCKKKEQEMDKIMEEMSDFLTEDDEEGINSKKETKKLSTKENNKRMKAEYDSYISKINAELDFDIEDEDDEDGEE